MINLLRFTRKQISLHLDEDYYSLPPVGTSKNVKSKALANLAFLFLFDFVDLSSVAIEFAVF